MTSTHTTQQDQSSTRERSRSSGRNGWPRHLNDPAVRVVEVDVSPAAYDRATSTAPPCGTSTAT